jgi:hypothetical protein
MAGSPTRPHQDRHRLGSGRQSIVTDRKGWTEEVSGTVAAAGLPWRVSTAWVEQHEPVYVADLIDTRSGRECRVSVESLRFPTAADRRAEIARQLQAHVKR